MKKTYTAELKNLDAILGDTSAFFSACGAASDQIYAANLAVDEIFTNIVNYGYGENPEKTVEFKFERTRLRGKSAISIEVSDSARAFNPLEEVDGPDLKSNIDKRTVGGLGVFFLKKSMDEVSYKRAKGRNVLSMVKILDK